MSDSSLSPAASHGGRRLAAIVFTDVVGYSARMQQDETGTMALVRVDFDRMRTLCAKHGGEVLKSTGDGLLLCFESVVQAVGCTLQMQKEFAARPTDSLQHRMGVHLGDVFHEGGDVAGDGVNIAARLETKARPGTICLSQSVYDAVKGKLPMQVESLGPQQFKNIAEQITVYLVTPGSPGSPASAGEKFWAWWLAGAAVVIAAALTVIFWPKGAPDIAAPKAPPAMAPAPVPVVLDKSIAVLPFTNMSDDKENAFFTDGVHEDILTHLANLGELKVVSRTSVMPYRDTKKPLRQVGAELGVAYILEGSVRRVGNKIRVTGQLINARTEGHVWSKYYDKDVSDVFAIQSALATEIATALSAVLSPQEKARLSRTTTTNATAYDLFLKARDLRYREELSTETLSRAAALLQSALEFDPKFAAAWGDLADVLARSGNFSYDSTGVRQVKIRQAIETMKRLAPDEPETWIALSFYFLGERNYAQSESYLQRAAQALPNNGRVIMLVTEMDKRHGRWSDALVRYRQAYALDRQNSEIRRALWEWLLALRHYDEAAAFAREEANADGLFLAQLPFYERGSTKEMEAWMAAHPQANREAIVYWKLLTGEAADFVRLIDEIRRDSPTGGVSSPNEAFYASALMAMGETDRAREVATRNVARYRARFGANSGAFSLSTNLALLGEKSAALESYAASLAPELAAGLNPDFINSASRRPFILALLGEKEKALAEFARLLNIPGELNVHVIRRSWMCKGLQGDPAFEAMLNDPANNAPIH